MVGSAGAGKAIPNVYRTIPATLSLTPDGRAQPVGSTAEKRSVCDIRSTLYAVEILSVPRPKYSPSAASCELARTKGQSHLLQTGRPSSGSCPCCSPECTRLALGLQT